MDSFFSSVEVRVVTSLAIALMVLVVYFSFDIWQFITRRDFGNVNAYLVLFTKHDNNPKDDRVVFELIGYKIPLREICRNRVLFWVIIWHSLKVTHERPVLNFSNPRKVLSPVRGRISQIWASMALKRASGLPFKEIPCQLALVYARSEYSRNFVMRVMLIQNRDLARFDEYLMKPPRNSDNFGFMVKIVAAYRAKTGSFISTRVTVA